MLWIPYVIMNTWTTITVPSYILKPDRESDMAILEATPASQTASLRPTITPRAHILPSASSNPLYSPSLRAGDLAETLQR